MNFAVGVNDEFLSRYHPPERYCTARCLVSVMSGNKIIQDLNKCANKNCRSKWRNSGAGCNKPRMALRAIRADRPDTPAAKDADDPHRDFLYLAAIVDSSDDAIVGVGLDGAILSWNPAREAFRLFRRGNRRSAGSLLWPPDRPEGPLGFVDRIVRGETVLSYETERLGKGGKRVQLSVSMFPVRDAEGRITAAPPWPATSPSASGRKKPCARAKRS